MMDIAAAVATQTTGGNHKSLLRLDVYYHTYNLYLKGFVAGLFIWRLTVLKHADFS